MTGWLMSSIAWPTRNVINYRALLRDGTMIRDSYMKIMLNDKPIGFSNSRRASQAVGLLEDSGIPILSSAAENFFSDNNNFFTTNPGVIDEAKHFFALARERDRTEALFVYTADDMYSEQFFKAAADQDGSFTTSTLSVLPGESPKRS